MNKIYKSLLTASVVVPALALTGCIEEVTPQGQIVSQEQVQEVPTSADSYAQGMPAYMNTVFVVPGERHFDFGYPSMMYIRDAITGDTPVQATDYDHFTYWREDRLMGEEYIFSQLPWWFYYKLIQTTNLTLSVIDKETTDAHNQALMGYAYAYRANAYLDLARMYEYLPTLGTSSTNADGHNVEGYTVPIVTDDMAEDQARNNPRVPHQEMFDFILSDLQKAEKFITAEERPSKVMPDLGVVYGLMARLYMWDENYPKAAEYARLAITTSGCTPLTAAEWTDTKKGFNDISSHSWMWGQNYTVNDDAVRTAIINYTSWCCNEFVNGYSAVGTQISIDANLYNTMRDDDCRKLCFVAPEGSALAGKEAWLNKAGMQQSDGTPINLPAYASLKIRPGQGNMDDYNVACAVGVPLMRVEEMIFIEAEAIAHSNPAEGKSLMESFMKQYRCPSFEILSNDVVGEIIQSKRVEFFLEGINFFDMKRLNMSVTRNYEGTNWYDACRFNTEGRPAWCNFVIVRQEADGNPALKGWNNPDPSDVYKDQISTGEEE